MGLSKGLGVVRVGAALFSVALAAAISCDGPPAVAPPPTVIATSVDGPAAIPPTATLRVRFSARVDPPSVTEDTVLVVRGLADDALLANADAPPLTPARRLELVGGALRSDGSDVLFTPARPFDEGALFSLVVTRNVTADGARLAHRVVHTFVTGPAASGAPVLGLVAPTDGETGVARNRRTISVAFTRPVRNVDATTLRLEPVDGPTAGVPVSATRVVEDGCDRCWRIEPLSPLDANRTYRVVADPSIVDSDGEPPFATAPPRFTTSSALVTSPPGLTAIAALPSSGCLVVRWQLDRPADGALEVDGLYAIDDALSLTHELVLPLARGSRAPWRLWSRDETSAPPLDTGTRRAPPSSSVPLVITEALTRPLAGGDDQQFVELHNVGADPVSLDGLTLSYDRGADTLPPVTVPPGGFALVVGANWLANDGADPVPPPATVIAPVEHARLGRYGLHASGESFLLSDGEGLPVSRFSTHDLTLAKGQSARRATPCDIASSWVPTAGATSSPGAP